MSYRWGRKPDIFKVPGTKKEIKGRVKKYGLGYAPPPPNPSWGRGRIIGHHGGQASGMD